MKASIIPDKSILLPLISLWMWLLLSSLGISIARATPTYIAEPDLSDGWTTSTNVGPDYRLLLGNRLVSGIIPGGTNPDNWSSSAAKTVTMPGGSDVRWSFWAQVLNAGIGPGWTFKPDKAGFYATVEGDTETIGMRIWMQQPLSGGYEYYAEVTGIGWTFERILYIPPVG